MTDDPEIKFGKNMAALLADIRESQQVGLVVDQAYVNRLAQRHGVDAPVLAPTPAELAKAKEAEDARAAKAKEAKEARAAKAKEAKEAEDTRASVASQEDFALRRRAFLADVRACRDGGIPIDQGFLCELCDRHGLPSSFATVEAPAVITASHREAQITFLSRAITEIQPDETGLTASELEACKAEGCAPEDFLAARRAQGPSR